MGTKSTVFFLIKLERTLFNVLFHTDDLSSPISAINSVLI